MKSSKIQKNVSTDSTPAKDAGDTRQDSGYQSSFIYSDHTISEPEIDLQEKSKQFDSGIGEIVTPTSPVIQQPLSNKESLDIWRKLFTPDEDFEIPLHIYIASRDLQRTFKIIKLAPHQDLLSFSNINSETPLHYAVQYNLPAAVRRLVVCGARPLHQDCFGNTALHHAAMLGHLDCARSLTEEVSLEEIQHAAPLYSVSPFRPTQTFLDRRNYEGEAALHLAVIHNHRELVEWLIRKKASINIKEGKAGRTPLHLAVAALNKELAEVLLSQSGTEVNCPNYGGYTPLDELRQSCNDNFTSQPLISMRALLLKYNSHNPAFGFPDSDSSSEEEEDVLDLQMEHKPLATVAG